MLDKKIKARGLVGGGGRGSWSGDGFLDLSPKGH